jgi:hypothetical protein
MIGIWTHGMESASGIYGSAKFDIYTEQALLYTDLCGSRTLDVVDE